MSNLVKYSSLPKPKLRGFFAYLVKLQVLAAVTIFTYTCLPVWGTIRQFCGYKIMVLLSASV